MPKKLTFTRPASLAGLAGNTTVARDLKRIHERFRRDFLPRSIWETANALLADKVLELKFSARCSYREAQDEVIRREPHLALGLRPYMPDAAFADVEIIDEEARHDARSCGPC